MALSGIQIYKLLPQTNCKECGFPTCLAFAMKLAAKQVELGACPYVSEESKKQLAESAAPPIRLITLKANGAELKVGNEVVMFRHEKTFYNKPGLFLRVKASDPNIAKKAAAAEAGKVTQKDREFRQYLREYQGLANKLMKLEGEGGGLLTDPTKFEEQRSQLKGEIQKYDNLLQTTSPELYKQIMTGAPAPAAETKSGEGKKLDRETAKVLFQEAGGDKEKARQLAKDRGYTL